MAYSAWPSASAATLEARASSTSYTGSFLWTLKTLGAVLPALSGDAWLMAFGGSLLSKVVTFVGVLPWEAALWAIDQCVVHRRGWALLSDVAVACLWLLRRPLRRIAKAKRGLDELRDLLRDGLRDAPLHELQALLAASYEYTQHFSAHDASEETQETRQILDTKVPPWRR